MAIVGFGAQDVLSYKNISAKLEQRNILSLGSWRSLTSGEFVSMLRTLELKSHPRIYLAALETATSAQIAQTTARGHARNTYLPYGLAHASCVCG